MTEELAILILMISPVVVVWTMLIIKSLMGFFSPKPYWMFKDGAEGIEPKKK